MYFGDCLPPLMPHPITNPENPIPEWEARKKEILDLLRKEEYGFAPPAPSCVKGEVLEQDFECCCGHAVLEKIQISFPTPKGNFSFPLKFFVPQKEGNSPLFLLINFRPDSYDRYFPAEEIIDRGFGLAVLYYEDVSTDDGNFKNLLPGQYDLPDSQTGWGKISIWAWAASRAIDYLITRPEVDSKNIAVIGHSRLGKTALWCAAQDERVSFVCSNEAGCAGTSLEHIKHPGAETTQDIVTRFPYWFCGNYQKYAGKPDDMPFDQHFLLAAIAPRYVAAGSANRDLWADPYAEQLCCLAASQAWNYYGKTGFSGTETPFQTGEFSNHGEIAYHLRDGVHFLGRADWLRYMDFIERHKNL